MRNLSKNVNSKTSENTKKKMIRIIFLNFFKSFDRFNKEDNPKDKVSNFKRSLKKYHTSNFIIHKTKSLNLSF